MFEKQKLELQVRSEPIQIQAFQTSIWDETLYAVRWQCLSFFFSSKGHQKLIVLIAGLGQDYSLLDTQHERITS